MPDHIENISQLSKDQLKSLLISHNLPLPQGDQRKAIYLELYQKHILSKEKESGDFSSDDEDLFSDNDLLPVEDKEGGVNYKMDIRSLSNTELKEQLLKHGIKPGPILPSTRAVYEKKLRQLLEETPPLIEENGEDDQDQYSDSDNEGTQVKKHVEIRREVRSSLTALNGTQNGSQFNIPASLAAEYNQNLATLGNDFSVTRMLKQPEDATPGDSPESMSQSSLGMSATRRKPIKGAAGRPIQFRYDDLATKARMQEITKTSATEKGSQRLVPVPLQIAIFIVVAFIALVFITLESSPENPFTPLTEDTGDVQQP